MFACPERDEWDNRTTSNYSMMLVSVVIGGNLCLLCCEFKP